MAKLRNAALQALENGPGLADAHVRAAMYYRRTWDLETSHAHLQKALVLDPNSPLALSAVAGTNVSRGRLDLAIGQQRRAVELDPLGFVSRANLAVFLVAAGRFDEGKSETLKALELNPAYEHQADIDLGYLLILQKQFDEALAAIQRWPAGQDRDKGLALVYHALGRQAESDAALGRLIAAGGVGAAQRVAEVYATRGEIAEAFQWLQTWRDRLLPAASYATVAECQTEVRLSPFLRPLHDDRRWDELFVLHFD